MTAPPALAHKPLRAVFLPRCTPAFRQTTPSRLGVVVSWYLPTHIPLPTTVARKSCDGQPNEDAWMRSPRCARLLLFTTLFALFLLPALLLHLGLLFASPPFCPPVLRLRGTPILLHCLLRAFSPAFPHPNRARPTRGRVEMSPRMERGHALPVESLACMAVSERSRVPRRFD
ncbi:hypothetical protein C8R43DRAFT_640681 [Mycena crocata]|nr:hypothetical protein C8R43DRAFT_640681 [Mycena crocata]